MESILYIYGNLYLMGQITFPYPTWMKGVAFFLIFLWAPFSFLRKYWQFEMIDIEMVMQPFCIGLVILYFSKEKKDDERIHYLKFRALAFAVINGLLLSWVITKFLDNWNYSIKVNYVHPISASLFLVVTIAIAYARLFYLKTKI